MQGPTNVEGREPLSNTKCRPCPLLRKFFRGHPSKGLFVPWDKSAPSYRGRRSSFSPNTRRIESASDTLAAQEMTSAKLLETVAVDVCACRLFGGVKSQLPMGASCGRLWAGGARQEKLRSNSVDSRSMPDR